MTPNPIAFRIGPLAIHWYGLLIATAVLVGAFIASREAERRGEDPEHIWNMLTLCLILGIVGARLYHVFSSPAGSIGWNYYRKHPIEIIAFWHGGFAGLGIFGVIAGGVLALFLYVRRHGLSFLRWMDITSPSLILGQAIGRWGNLFNQELYGYPTDLPWAIYIDPEHRLPGLEDFERFHPCFLYESLWNLAGFLFLMYVARRRGERLLDGDIVFLYLVWYPFGRVFVEALRPDAWRVGGIPVAQIICAASIAASVALMAYRHQRAHPTKNEPSASS